MIVNVKYEAKYNDDEVSLKSGDANKPQSEASPLNASKRSLHQSSSSLLSGDQSSSGESGFTGITKQTVSTSSTNVNGSLTRNELLSPSSLARRRRNHKHSGNLRLKAFKPKLNVPPLNFGAAGLVGRDKELSTLKTCYDRLVKDHKKELVLVGGQSGIGKSCVIRSVENLISVEGLFVEGKFDMNTSSEPYSGVAKAFGLICRKVKEAGSEVVADLQKELTKELGGTPELLLQMIPDLRDILVVEKADPAVGSVDRVDETEGGVDRLRFAFRVLTRVFSARFSPLVLFLDDLQWSDVSSLQVLEYLISDTQNEHPLMIIGSYRTEDVDENSLLHNKMVALREKTEQFQFHMAEFKIESFTTSDIEKIITSVLPSLRADHIVGLAELCHKRTLGNPFFTIQFLKMLHLEGMLDFDRSTKTWSWDLSTIEKETMSTANVVVMLEQHLRKLPEQVQALLQCAAYLGSVFNEPTIDLVWSVYGRRLIETRTKPVATLLPLLVNDKVFEKGGNKEYRWCHDKLQEAALSLSGERRETFQLDIGKTLYYGLTQEQVEEDLFTIVDLVNNGNTLKRPEFAGVNLRAAEKARELAAFKAASEYAAEGIRLLENADWNENRATLLSLCIIGSESELILGNVDAAERYRDMMLSKPGLSTLEMLPLQIGKAKALGDIELKSKEALEYCLKLLKDLGCQLTWVRPTAIVQAVFGAIRTIKKAKAKPQSFFESMEPSDDMKLKYMAYLLSKAAYNAYTAGDTAMYLLATVRLVELTMTFGVHEYSATGFTYLAVLSIVVLQDFEAMERFQNIALGMLQKFRGMHNAETIFVGHQLGLLWVRPHESSRAIVEEGILAGRKEGDVVWAMWCVSLHVINTPYVTGRPLRTILDICPSVLAEHEETKLAAHQLSTRNYYQMLLNLNDPSCEKPSVHFGEIYSYSKEDHKDNVVHLADKLVAEGELVFWHEDYVVSANHALKVGETHAKIAPANYWYQLECFHRAIALYASAIQTRKRKYRNAANKIRKRIAKWAKYGNTSIQYYSIFLTAEKLALEKKHEEAKIKYEQALQAVGDLGHLHHLGLFNERYSDFLLRNLSLENESRDRLGEAIRYFKEWGAVHKVKALQSRL